MGTLAALLDDCPRLLVGRIPLRGAAIVVGDPYFVTAADAIDLPLGAQQDQLRPAVYVLRTAVPQWGRRNLATWLRIREDGDVGRLEPLAGAFGVHTFQSDTGLGSYMDVPSVEAFLAHRETFRLANPERNYHGDVLAPLLRQSADRPQDEWDAGSRALFIVPGVPDSGIALFQCGLGGGGFATYLEWSGDSLVGVVTDFGVLDATGVTLAQGYPR